jgi:amino acid transporter
MSSINKEKLNLIQLIGRGIFGAPKDLRDPNIFHKLSLIPLLAWIGLGADGLSSSSYGPEEAFRSLGEHTYLAVFLALATALTITIISYSYSRIIEHFPYGGGGYIVATHMLGEKAGVISGSALIVDYILTVTVSITACVDAFFSYLPIEFQRYKILTGAVLILIMVVLNIRGVKESILLLAPVFIVFVLSHILLLGYGIFSHLTSIKPIVTSVHRDFSTDLSTIGGMGIFLIFLRAYSLGGGTYTGIEAVSNGLQIMREPKVHTGKKTMFYMATSLAVLAGGLFFCYLMLDIKPIEGKTLNAVLANALFGKWPLGQWIALITILSESALLLVGAQAGFVDAPRVMANMAVDSWLPRRFASFSERLTMKNGIILIGSAAIAILYYTRGSISALVVMYSINVFLTFSLSEFGMSLFFIKHRKSEPKWKNQLSIQLVGLVLSLTILVVTIFEKFAEGGWLTLLITVLFVVVCHIIHRHYGKVRSEMMQLDKILTRMPPGGVLNTKPIDKTKMTAIQLVGDYNGMGIHSLFSINRKFPGLCHNFIFVRAIIVDQGAFKGREGIADAQKNAEDGLKKYVELARKLGFPAEYRMAVGTDVVDTAADLCLAVAKECTNSIVFSGKLLFPNDKFYYRLLHNETAYAVQRRLQRNGITNVILPIKIYGKT